MKLAIEQRFLPKVRKRRNGCHEWVACCSTNGYGVFRLNGKNVPAHRISWVLTYGEIQNNMQVLHKCDNPLCVNPNHLFLGTQKDNVIDMYAKKRDKYSNGYKHSEETKAKQSNTQKGRQYRLGFKHSEESKLKMSEKAKGNKRCLGRIVSDTTKLKMSNSQKLYNLNKSLSEEG
jgi:hypothetical protein